MTRILIEHQKHGTVYWDATGDKLYDAALQILRGRVADGYMNSPDAPLNVINVLAANDGKKAWSILRSRNGHEYERVEAIEILDPRKPDGTLRRSYDACEDELEVVRNTLRDAPAPDNLMSYSVWYDYACDYLETCP